MPSLLQDDQPENDHNQEGNGSPASIPLPSLPTVADSSPPVLDRDDWLDGDQAYTVDYLLSLIEQLEGDQKGEAEAALKDFSNDPEAIERVKAKVTNRSLQKFVHILQDSEQPVEMRGWAATLLGRLGEESCLKIFESELSKLELHPTIRRWIVDGIYRLGSIKGIGLLAREVHDDPDPDVRRRTILRLRWLGQEYPDYLPEIRRQASNFLIDALSDTDSNCARQAILTLGLIGEKRAFSNLVSALQKDWLQWAAIDGLGYLGDPRAIPYLVEFLHHENQDLRFAAIYALGEIGHKAPGTPSLERAIQPLIEVLEAKSEVESLHALRTLEAILGKEKAARLLAGLIIKPDSDEKRPGLLRGLGWLVDKESAFTTLKDKLYDGDEEERRAAEDALRSMGLSQAVDVLVRKRVGELYREYYAEPIRKVEDTSLELLKDTVMQVKRGFWISAAMSIVTFMVGIGILTAGAIRVLGGIGDPTLLFTGAGGIVAGILTVLGNFAVGPLKNLQKSLADLAQVESAFLSFIRRIGLASLTYAREYLQKEDPDPNMLALTTESMREAMQDTLLMIEIFSGGGDTIEKLFQEDGSMKAVQQLLFKAAENINDTE